jgi:outer membrane receptor protein involved in Fe transport
LVTTNPWINVPTNIDITTNDKKYIEVQINAGKRLDYGFNFSLNNYKNLPLINRVTNVNPLYNGLMYNALFEKEASTIELAANLRYQFSDKLLILNNFKYIQFNSLLENAKPWGILPMELDSKINWLPNSKWNIAGSVKFWTGATMLNDKKLPVDMKNAFVLNAMVQYKLTSNWSTWVKGENLLDRPYERWLDYPSLGVQILGGVVYSFRK